MGKQNRHLNLSYKAAGVDIDAGDELVEMIKPLARATKITGVIDDLGGFGALFDLKKCGFKDPILVSGTDGVGTKLKIAAMLNDHSTIGIDLVAMCVNDLIVQGARPLFFLDYFASSKLSLKTANIVIKGIADGCKQAGCALVGGETAEMPDLYKKGDYDLAGFALGAVERDEILPKKNIKAGDIILGLKSSGVHSNGFSLVRYIIKKRKIDLAQKFIGKKTLGEILLTPTKIYVQSCLAAVNSGAIKAFAHITGGGLLENIPRILPKNLRADIDYSAWQMPKIFGFLQEEGNIKDNEMRRTFNCGIGMVVICDAKDVAKLQKIFAKFDEETIKIGIIANLKNS